jgi:2-keto-4-pentenoate hydratase/2-oxohepta-3-ene-1,7-dioic acid hydratase in catechol pathway
MKLLRYGPAGSEKPGLLDAEGKIRDLSAHLPDLTPERLSDESLAALKKLDPKTLPLVNGAPRLGIPIAGTRQCVAIGLNYRKHAIEANMPIPEEPVIFFKAITSLSGPNDDIVLPPKSQATDWEIELAIIIGRKAQRVAEAQALDYVAGYAIANDVSERDWQIKRGGQWSKGKSFDTFCPVGPWLVTRDELPNPQTMALELKVNGTVKQSSSTEDMIFGCAKIVAYCSQFMTLLPGDVIITGTPGGVGVARKPQEFLRAGDTVQLKIARLGEQTQRVNVAF